ncbi:glycosyltransferase involved in cell wall biosynthesis [Nakamurella sp. UYEF19]|uniref:glycosyltransferase family 4 protein n=1 Tax=Nakamurella sp. UYEF19 TaxID=1756392 RepID=UPI00339198C6
MPDPQRPHQGGGLLTLITEQMLARVPGGTGRYSREVATAVGAAVPSGWQVRAVTAWHRDLRPARVPEVAGPYRLPAEARVLARLWERGLPPTVAGRVIHALTPLAPPRLRRGQSLVVTVHDAVPYTHPETLTPRGAAWHRLMIERAAAIAGALVVPTNAVAAALAEAGVGGRIEVISEGAAPSLKGPVPVAEVERVKASFGLPDRYALVVGTLEPRKGLDILLDAMALGRDPMVPLVVVGQPGWGDADVEQEALRRGIADRVLVLGRLPDEELTAVLGGASVEVVPSRSEGFGLPLLEAMSRGIPVVHSDAAALVEVAGDAGICVPVGDVEALAAAISTVLTDPELAVRLSTAGRLRAADFSWDAVAEELWALYLDVAAADAVRQKGGGS